MNQTVFLFLILVLAIGLPLFFKISESLKGEKHYLFGVYGSNHPLSKKVYQINKDTNEIIKEWGSIIEAERLLKIRSISSVCKGHHKTAGGFKWAYVKNYLL